MTRKRKRLKKENQPRPQKPSPSQGGHALALPDRPRALTASEFQALANVPAEVEWFANINNQRTRRAYRIDIEDFMTFVGIERPEEFRLVTRAHVIAWRKSLEEKVCTSDGLRNKDLFNWNHFAGIRRIARQANSLPGPIGGRV